MRMTPMTLTAALGLSLMASPRVSADYDRLQNAATMVREMAAAADNGIPESLFAKAKCVALIPGVKKGALGVGGQYGRGYLSCRNGSGWSAPGAVRIEGGSIGFQIGATDTDLILLVLNDRGVDRLLSSKFTIGADAAVAAGPVGRQATAQTDATMMAEMLAWSRSRGVFAGVSLQGSTLREDGSENRDNYGKTLTNREIVKGSIEAPKGATELLAALAKY
jgi:lipid-binding SYLF domain-containing protein